MELIIDFYKGLDTLNLIIFWGIIIVIILLLIFSCILINKNKKLKKMVETKIKYEEELPIKKEKLEENIKEKEIETKKEIIEVTIPEIPVTEKQELNNILDSLETEKKFIAEEHVMEYNKNVFTQSNDYKEEKRNYEIKTKPSIEMPTAPYQRNVLREMSLSQTSPIGINMKEKKEDKKIEMAKDLEESLNNEEIEISFQKEEFEKIISKEENKKELVKNNIEEKVKQELKNIENISPRKTEIKAEPILKAKPSYELKEIYKEEQKPIYESNYSTVRTESIASELLNSQPKITEEKDVKSSSEKYLEEVSRKLAEAEIPDEIERTNYELKQEEDAIISYKELMEKKDSIQTIDEEEAIISIEELMNRSIQKQEEVKEDTKLYKLSDAEENDNFIKELKQFRNDL